MWDSVDKPGMDKWRSQLDELLKSNAHEVIESNVHDFIETDDPALAAITAICDKIIARGNPTLVDPNWERILLSGPGSEFLRWEEPDDPEVKFRMKDSLWPEGRIESLVDAAMDLLDLPWTDEWPASRQRLPAELQDKCSSEEEALYADLIAALGPGANGAVQRQALIFDLVDGFATSGLTESRVDFALQLSRANWVIEVDGVQHLERAQRGKDAFRDSVLQAGGWRVLRVEASRVRSSRTDWLRQTLVDADQEESRSLTIGTSLRSVVAALRESMLHRAAWHLLLRPLAVQRCLRGLLMLYRYGALDANKPQRILAVEEDIPAVADAFQMLQELWELTAALHRGLGVRPLTFSLDVIGRQEVQGSNLTARYVKQPDGDYDAVISHSLLLGEGFSGSALARTKPALAEGTLRIRRAIGCRTDRRLQWAPGFNNWLESSHHILEGSLTRLLQIVFRKRKFKDGQFLSIARLLQGEPAIVLLPTGGGKSLIYQFVGMLLPGMTVIVDPIISLMDDQVRSLKEMGIDKAKGISSQIEDIDEMLQCMSRGELFFVFVSPERLQSEKFRNEIQEVTGRVPISLVALDEAHCLSEWGHDFRPAYLNLPLNLQRYCMDRETEALPTLVALTGTASYAVLEDIQAELD